MKYFYQHYISIRLDNAVMDAWSDGPHPAKDTANAICINEKGTYQFRLHPGGEENPAIRTMDGIPLYKLDGKKIIPRAEKEIEADRARLNA